MCPEKMAHPHVGDPFLSGHSNPVLLCKLLCCVKPFYSLVNKWTENPIFLRSQVKEIIEWKGKEPVSYAQCVNICHKWEGTSHSRMGLCRRSTFDRHDCRICTKAAFGIWNHVTLINLPRHTLNYVERCERLNVVRLALFLDSKVACLTSSLSFRF